MEAALHRAIRRGDVEAFKDILASGVDICSAFSHEPPLISLVQQVVQENFTAGLAHALRSSPVDPSSDCSSAIRRTFSYAMKHERYEIIRVFLLCALEGSSGCFIMPANDVFKHAMEAMLYDVALKAI